MDFSKPLQKIYLHYNFSEPFVFIEVSISHAKQHYFTQVHLLDHTEAKGCGKKGGLLCEFFFYA